MPRLLLVDDNPSIHKIAETLLAASAVELTSCGSGAEAMALVNRGEHFDVALLDTSMLGMDGWALLQELRATEATARMPVAMMAGVLDAVDPEKLRLAPIQGFLKKPVELRDLGERVMRLLETPVPAPPPVAPDPEPEPEAAFLTRPALAIPAELRRPADADDVLLLGPEDLDPAEDLEVAEIEMPHALDAGEIPQAFEAIEESPEAERSAEAPDEAEAEPLDLEELDLEGLQGLSFPTSAMPDLDALEAPVAAAGAPAPESVPEFLLADTLPEAAGEAERLEPEAERLTSEPEAERLASEPEAELLETEPEAELLDAEPAPAAEGFADHLPDLGPELDQPIGGQSAAPAPANLLELGEPIDWSDESDSLVGMALDSQEASTFLPDQAPPVVTTPLAVLPEVTTLSDILDPPAATPLGLMPEVITLSDILDPLPAGLPPAAAPVAAPVVADPVLAAPVVAEPVRAEAAPAAGSDPLASLQADQVLMDLLAKALVARLGDQVLREIAWEVMPELAARVPRARP